MLLTWSGNYKKNGKPRKSLLGWSRPKRQRDDYPLPDGLWVVLDIRVADLKKKVTVRLFSGNEFNLPVELQSKLEQIWERDSSHPIEFTLDLKANAPGISQLIEWEQADIRKAVRLLKENQSAASEIAAKYPSRRLTRVSLFSRNPLVVAKVLARSAGFCEVCGQPAPFKRLGSGEPYLEVHHLHWLSNGGEDTADNAVALCPNCHREAHCGIFEIWRKKLPEKYRLSASALDDVEGKAGE